MNGDDYRLPDGNECQVAVKYGGGMITVEGRYFGGTMKAKRDDDYAKPTQIRDE